MARDIYIYTGLFTASLGLAWWASTPQSSKDPERRALVSIAAGQIGKIEYQAPEVKVEIAPAEGPEKFWISTEKTIPATNPNNPAAPTPSKDRFLASAKLKDVFAQLNPLEALRTIGGVKDDALQEYGLKDTQKIFKIADRSGSEVISLAIGKQAYGTRNYYAMNTKDKSVLLISGDLLGDVEKADIRLYERTVTNIVFEEIQHAVITVGKKSRKLAHTRRDDKGGLIWTDDEVGTDAAKADATKAVASAKSWFERLDRVRVVSFASAEEAAKLKDAPVIFEVSVDVAGGTKDHFVYKKTPGTEAGGTDYWVYTDFLGAFAKVGATRLEPIEKDLTTILEH